MSLQHSKKESQEAIDSVFKSSYDSFYDNIYKFCYVLLGSKNEALDCVQETFIRYYERLQTGISIKNHKAYIYKIAKCVCAKRQHQIELLKRKYSDLSHIIYTLNIEEQIELEQYADRIDDIAAEIINSLEPDEKQLYDQHFINGIPVKEIAKSQKVTPSWINKRIVKLEQSVKRKLKRYLSGGDFFD